MYPGSSGVRGTVLYWASCLKLSAGSCLFEITHLALSAWSKKESKGLQMQGSASLSLFAAAFPMCFWGPIVQMKSHYYINKFNVYNATTLRTSLS